MTKAQEDGFTRSSRQSCRALELRIGVCTGPGKTLAGAIIDRRSSTKIYTSTNMRFPGIVSLFQEGMSGHGRAQVTRQASRQLAGMPLIKECRAPEHAFAQCYSGADVALLAEVDQAMGTLSGPATACVLRRRHDVSGEARCERLGSHSVGHLYKLRDSTPYLAKRIVKNRPVPATVCQIEGRYGSATDGRPGFIRVDTVITS